MSFLRSFIVIAAFILSTVNISAQSNYQYISPQPGLHPYSQNENIIIRYGEELAINNAPVSALTVAGSKSGIIQGSFVLADDHKTLVFEPDVSYSPGERINVHFKGDVITKTGKKLPPLSFSFDVYEQVSNNDIDYHQYKESYTKNSDILIESMNRRAPLISFKSADSSLPNDLSSYEITNYDSASPGKIFTCVWYHDSLGHYILIVDEFAQPIFYKELGFIAEGFELQESGIMTYYDRSRGTYVMMDSSYNEIGTKSTTCTVCGNDTHEFKVLKNGEQWLLAQERHPMDMGEYITGGSIASVIDFVIQKFDSSGNNVWNWHSKNYFNPGDAVYDSTRLLDNTVDYCHMNSIEPDTDTSIIISSRHMSEVTRINTNTGEIIWRFGGKHNEFQMLDSAETFSFQHDARRLPNGLISIFDNGNQKDPQYSRAVHFDLDEELMTAREEQVFINDPVIFSGAMANAQYMKRNGHVFVGWGTYPAMTEFNMDGSMAQYIHVNDGNRSYRSFKYPWKNNALLVSQDSINFGTLEPGKDSSAAFSLSNNTDNDITVTGLYAYFDGYSIDKSVPFTIPARGSLPVTLTFSPEIYGSANTFFYFHVDGEVNGYKQRYSSYIFVEGNTIASNDTAKAISPVNNELNADVRLTFTWENLFGYNNYQLIIAKDSLFNDIFINDSLIADTTKYIDSLEYSKKYYWKVRGNNKNGTVSNYSELLNFTTTEMIKPPVNFNAYAEGDSAIVLTWSDSSDNETGFAIERTLTSENVFSVLDSTDSGAQMYRDTEITTGSSYAYRIFAYNDFTRSYKTPYVVVDIVGIEERGRGLPESYMLKQNYPNPFNPSTTISYALPEKSSVKIRIYNVLGQLVKVLRNKVEPAGYHEAVFNAESLPSGIYLYDMQAVSVESSSEYNKTAKMILLK